MSLSEGTVFVRASAVSYATFVSLLPVPHLFVFHAPEGNGISCVASYIFRVRAQDGNGTDRIDYTNAHAGANNVGTDKNAYTKSLIRI